MPNQSQVKAYKCKTCKGLGKTVDGRNCSYCMGSGYIGSDGTYEYILQAAEGGKFVITDIKLPSNQEENFKEQNNPKTEEQQGNFDENKNSNKEDWDKKVKKFWINLVNVLFVMALMVIVFLYFFVMKEEKSLISIGVIILSLLILFNISRSSIFDKLKELIVKNWNEPKDYLYFLKEKRKRESE